MSACTVKKKVVSRLSFFSNIKSRYKPCPNVVDHTDMNCSAGCPSTASAGVLLMLRVMYYESVGSNGVFLTRNDLQHAVLLHVSRKVPGSHVLLHYAHVGQFLAGAKTTEKFGFKS